MSDAHWSLDLNKEDIEWRDADWTPVADVPGLYTRAGRVRGRSYSEGRWNSFFKSDVDQGGMIRVPSHNYDGTLRTTFQMPVDFGKDLPYGNGEEAQKMIQAYVNGTMNHSLLSFMGGPPYKPSEITPITDEEWDKYKLIARYSPWLGRYVAPSSVYEPSDPTPGVNYADPEVAARLPEAQRNTWQQYQDFLAHREAAGIPEDTTNTNYSSSNQGGMQATESNASATPTTSRETQLLNNQDAGSQIPEAWRDKTPRQLAAMGIHPGVLGPRILGPGEYDPTSRDDPLRFYVYSDPQIGATIIPEPNADTGHGIGNSMNAFWESPYIETFGVTPYGMFFDDEGKRWRYGVNGANAKNEELGIPTRFDPETNQVDPNYGYVQPGYVYYTPPSEAYGSDYDNAMTSRGLTFAPDSHYSRGRTGLTVQQVLDYTLSPEQIKAAWDKAAADSLDDFHSKSPSIQSNKARSAAMELYIDHPAVNLSYRQSANRKLHSNGGDMSLLNDQERRALETDPNPNKYPIDWTKIRQDMPNASRAYGYPTYEEWAESAPANNVITEGQTSFQTGSVSADTNFTTEEEIMQRIAAIRSGRGLADNAEDDKRWTEMIIRGQASIGDARTSLTGQALGYTHADTSPAGNSGYIEPVYPEPNPNPPSKTPSGHEIIQRAEPTVVGSDGAHHRIFRMDENERAQFGLPINSDEWYDYLHRNFPDRAQQNGTTPLPGTRGAYPHGWNWDQNYNGPEGPIPQDPRWRQINIFHPDYTGRHPEGVTIGLDPDSAAAASYDASQRTSFQTGSVGGDANYTTQEEIQERVAAIRRGRGLSPDEADDVRWTERIVAGQASIGDARTALNRRADSLAASATSNQPRTEPTYSAADQTSFQTGSVSGDANFTTREEIQERIAAIRRGRGLSPDEADDIRWTDRIVAGQASIGDARTTLTNTAAQVAAQQPDKDLDEKAMAGNPTENVSDNELRYGGSRPALPIEWSDDKTTFMDANGVRWWTSSLGQAARQEIGLPTGQLEIRKWAYENLPTPSNTTDEERKAFADGGFVTDRERRFGWIEYMPDGNHIVVRGSDGLGGISGAETPRNISIYGIYRNPDDVRVMTVEERINSHGVGNVPINDPPSFEPEAPAYDPSAQTSFQTGSVDGDANFTTQEEIQERIAAIRRGRGLAPDEASDRQWAERVLSGSASIGDVRTILTNTAQRIASETDESTDESASGLTDETDPEEALATSTTSSHNTDNQTSFQTGSVDGDKQFKTEDEIRRRVAQIRQHRGLSADHQSDREWANKIVNGQATIGDARTALSLEADKHLQSGTSTNNPDVQPVTVVGEDEKIRRQVAQIRHSLDLPTDPASDQIWVDRITSGSADIYEARRRLEQEVEKNNTSTNNTTASSSTTPSAQTQAQSPTPQLSEADKIRQEVASYRRSLGLPASTASDNIWVDRITSGSADMNEAKRRLDGERVRLDVAAYRQSLGLPPSSESDQIWVDRITSGSADMNEAKRRLDGAAKDQGLISMNAASLQSADTSGSGLQTLPGATPTKSDARSTNVLPGNLA